MSMSPNVRIGPWFRCHNGNKYTVSYAIELAETEFKQRLFCPYGIQNADNHYFMPNVPYGHEIVLPDIYESYAIHLREPPHYNAFCDAFATERSRLNDVYGWHNVFLEWGIWNWVA